MSRMIKWRLSFPWNVPSTYLFYLASFQLWCFFVLVFHRYLCFQARVMVVWLRFLMCLSLAAFVDVCDNRLENSSTEMSKSLLPLNCSCATRFQTLIWFAYHYYSVVLCLRITNFRSSFKMFVFLLTLLSCHFYSLSHSWFPAFYYIPCFQHLITFLVSSILLPKRSLQIGMNTSLIFTQCGSWFIHPSYTLRFEVCYAMQLEILYFF